MCGYGVLSRPRGPPHAIIATMTTTVTTTRTADGQLFLVT